MSALKPITLSELTRRHPQMPPPLIDGLLRRSEVMNLIASPKTGKTWLAMQMAVAVAAGLPWLGRPTRQADVLYIDNELHPAALAARLPEVAAAMCPDPSVVADRIHVQSLRSTPADLHALRPYFNAIPAGRYGLVVLDALYRALPADVSESDNAQVAALMADLCAHAARLNASFVLIHHASKGQQVYRAVTDVGSGAGSLSRAVDSHAVLRHHDEEGVVVMEAVCRSFPPPNPLCLRWTHPLWTPDPTLDPSRLRSDWGGRSRQRWTAETFARRFVPGDLTAKQHIIAEAAEVIGSERKALGLLRKAEAAGLVRRIAGPGNRDPHYRLA